MKAGIWELNKMEGKNPVHTGGFLTGYDQREFSADEVTARESAQNSGDAGREVKGVTELVFQYVNFTGEKKKKLIREFRLDNLFEQRLPALAQEAKNKTFCERVRSFLDNDSARALIVRDFKTCGLGGAWDEYERSDHFGRLVCALNLDDKADGDENSGGSFGLGKTAYAKSSLINTVVYHSVFEPTPRTKNTSRRFMIAGVYPKHKVEPHRYGGFAYYGKPAPDETTAVPFEDGEAETVWNFIADCANVNLKREVGNTGTDILILNPAADLQKLKTAIEDYYFPAIIDGQLAVRFIDDNGKTHHPDIHARKDLRQFVQLLQDAKAGEKIEEPGRLVDKLNRYGELNIGAFAFSAANEDTAASPRNNYVAVMRGTGMVINYLKLGSEQYEPAVGVFLADKDIYKYLIASENAAHSEWSEHSLKLDTHYPGQGKEIVKRTNSALRTRFSKFQKELQPDFLASKTESGLLSRLLSNALSGTKGGKQPVKEFYNPVALSLTRKERDGGVSKWRLQVDENEYTPKEPFDLLLLPSISLAGDSKMVAIKHMEFAVKDAKGRIIEKGTKPEIKVQFKPGANLDYTVEFPNPGEHNYIVVCKCISVPGVPNG